LAVVVSSSTIRTFAIRVVSTHPIAKMRRDRHNIKPEMQDFVGESSSAEAAPAQKERRGSMNRSPPSVVDGLVLATRL
jgi:hypothetical protein